MLEMWHMQLLAKCDVRNVPENMGPSQRQVLGHVRNVRVTSKFVSDAPGEIHGTASNEPSEAVSRAEAALKAAEAPGLAEDFIRNLKDEVSRRKEEQLKQRPVGKHLDAAKSALTQTATLMARRNQKVAAAEARADQAKAMLQAAYQESQRYVLLTQNDPRSTPIRLQKRKM